jgi:hypothetical protein
VLNSKIVLCYNGTVRVGILADESDEHYLVKTTNGWKHFKKYRCEPRDPTTGRFIGVQTWPPESEATKTLVTEMKRLGQLPQDWIEFLKEEQQTA